MANGGQRFSLFPPLGSGTTSSTVQPSALLLVDQPTPGGGYTTQVATAAQIGAAYWNNGISSQSAGMVSWNGALLLTRRIVAASSNIVVNNGDGSANVGIDLATSLDFTATTVTGGTFTNPVLVNPTISGLSFSGTTISGGTWINGTLTGVINATGATLSGATLQGATFTGTILDSGTISGGTVSGAVIVNGTLSGAIATTTFTLIGGTLSGSTLSGGTVAGGTVSGSTIQGGTFTGSINATGATISGGTISNATLSGYALVTVGAAANIPSSRRIVQGTNVTITDGGPGSTLTISVSGVGTGTVTQVSTQSGLTGGPITVTGSIGLLAQASVVSGNYTNATVSVNSFGIVTGIASGTAAAAGITWSTISSTTTGVNNGGYACNTTTSTFTLNLPTGPAVGNQIMVADAAGTFNTNQLTISAGTAAIMGTVSSLFVTTQNACFGLVYVDSPNGWRIF